MLNNDHGNSLAFGIILAGVFILGAAFAISLFLTPFNISFIPAFNSLIDNNIPAQQTADAFGFYRDVAVATPVFVLFGVLLWAWIRGLEARN